MHKEDIHSEIHKRFLYHYSGLCHLCFQNSVLCLMAVMYGDTPPACCMFHNFYTVQYLTLCPPSIGLTDSCYVGDFTIISTHSLHPSGRNPGHDSKNNRIYHHCHFLGHTPQIFYTTLTRYDEAASLRIKRNVCFAALVSPSAIVR